MLSEPGLLAPSGRFFAPAGTGTTAKPPGVFFFWVPLITPPLFVIATTALDHAAQGTGSATVTADSAVAVDSSPTLAAHPMLESATKNTETLATPLANDLIMS